MTLVSDIALLVIGAEGRVRLDSGRRRLAVSGAALLTLALAGRVEVARRRWGRADLLRVCSTQPTGDRVLDACLARSADDAVASADGMIGRYALRAMRDATSQLVELKLAISDPGPNARWFRRTPIALIGSEPVQALLSEISQALDGGRAPTVHSLGLVGVLDSARILKKLSPSGRPAPVWAPATPEPWIAAGVSASHAGAAAAVLRGLSFATMPT